MNKITSEELAQINQLKTRAGFLALQAEKMILESQLGEEQHLTAVLRLYIKYKLGELDKIDEQSGEIIYASVPVISEPFTTANQEQTKELENDQI